MTHPGIMQAVAFPMPDERLGEDVAAAVVLRPNARVDEDELRSFAAGKLADWKVPRRIAIVAELPKSATGKIVRHTLASLLDLRPPDRREPNDLKQERVAYELDLAQIWCGVLQLRSVEPTDDFLALGGDSVLAGQVIARVRAQLGRELSILAFFDNSTLRSMATAIGTLPKLDTAALTEPNAMSIGL